jgi:hypothetical protein
MSTIRSYRLLANNVLVFMPYLLVVNAQATPYRIYTKPIDKDPPWQCLFMPGTRPCDLI